MYTQTIYCDSDVKQRSHKENQACQYNLEFLQKNLNPNDMD